LNRAKAATPKLAATTLPVLVRLGDTLETVAYRYRTTLDVLERMNQIKAGEMISAGTVLLVPALPQNTEPAEDREDYLVVPRHNYAFPGRQRLFYKVRTDDALPELARAFGVSAAEIVRWNGLEEKARLQEDMTLQLYLPQGADLSRVRTIKPSQAQLLVTGSPEFIAFFEAQKGRSRVVVAAQAGDTLSKIGARHGMSVGMMERINRFSRDKVLSAGEAVVVYTKQNVPKSQLLPDAQAKLPPIEPMPDRSSQASLEGEPKAEN
jgi:membrane-bound lytic murein transglycosylase D